MSTRKPPTLALVQPEDVTDAAGSVAEESTTAPQPEQVAAPITVGQQIQQYAGLIARLKRSLNLSEGTLVKVIELALNERFTLIQMGLARPRPAPEEQPTDDSESPSAE